MQPQTFAAKRYDNQLKRFLDGRDEPIYFYIVGDHLVGEQCDESDPCTGSGLPAFLVSPTKLTDEQITELFNIHDPDVTPLSRLSPCGAQPPRKVKVRLP